GNAAGAALKDYNLGSLGNTIAGAIGGVGGGQILQALIPAIESAAAGGNLDLGAIGGQIVGGGAGGALLTVIAGLVKGMMASQRTRRTVPDRQSMQVTAPILHRAWPSVQDEQKPGHETGQRTYGRRRAENESRSIAAQRQR